MFIIDFQKKEAIFEQIVNQVIKFKELGILKPGDKLPSVRSLAVELGINPNTVSKAYQELETKGVVSSMNKKGVFITDDNSNLYANTIINSFTILLKDAKRNNIDKKILVDLINKNYGGDMDD